MSWWRAHDKSVNNRKLQKLPGELFKAWYNVNCLASSNGGVVPPIEDVAFALRLTEQRAAALLTQLATAKMLDREGDNFIPHDWDEHQFKSDKTDPTAPLRQKRYRDKKRNDRNATVTDTVTVKRPEAEPEADSEQSRDAGAPIDEDLKRKIAALQAGVSAHFVSRALKIPNLDRCRLWLSEGIAAGTVLVAVETVLKRGTKPATMDYFEGPVRDAHAKAAPENLQIVPPGEFIVEGTLEWACWDRYLRETTGRGSPVTDSKDTNDRYRRGWWRPTKVPPGYDEATGEKPPPQSEEENAA
jgi:hypothetical protein